MSLESKSQELKDLVATYDTQWFLGELSNLLKAIANGRANDQLGMLSSPMRQLYFLGGLMMSTDPLNGHELHYKPEKWNQIVELLNQIEVEYDKLFFPDSPEEVDEDWKHIRKVAMPSFLGYFNQGPLNYEEQTINWTRDLFVQLEPVIEQQTGLKVEDFLHFYEALDHLHQRNFQGHTTNPALLRPNWKEYTTLATSPHPDVPIFIHEMMAQDLALYTFKSDYGIIDRFYPEDLVSEILSSEKITKVLDLLTTRRAKSDFLYYTSTKPGNPLFEKPIVDIGDGLFQVFEVKQVIHAIENLFERLCTSSIKETTKYVDKKGTLLEARVIEIFTDFIGKDCKIYQSYYVDGCEQDILILWKKYAFIIEAKGYGINEPFRDPNRAFVRIKSDFDACIGYAYKQTRRVEEKFVNGIPLRITDKNGNLIEEIDTSAYEQDFSIIVNIKTFGQIQVDLSTLLKLPNEDDVYPWAIKLDDLEVFLLTLKAKGKSPQSLVDYLLMREELHGKLFCYDELQVCGGFLMGKFTQKAIEDAVRITPHPDFTTVFDLQYNKEMGFKNEKLLEEKKSGKFLFW